MENPVGGAAVSEATALWRVELLGGFCLHDGGATRHTRLHSRQVVALLARLAIYPRRDHAREELIELLWSGVDLATGRKRLRHALSVLKTILEPPDRAGAPMLDADRTSVRLVPGAIACDVTAFVRAADAGDAALASSLYRGELLPGHYSEWVQVERSRLAALHERCLARAATASRRPIEPSDLPVPVPFRQAQACIVAPDRPVEAVGLPNYLTRLFGAEAQVAGLCAAVRAERLVTLLGPGGCGKSRLAIEVAHRFARQTTDVPFVSVVRVSLVEAADRRQALDAIGRGLRIELAEPSLEVLVARLEGRRALLLLDNLEQLVGHGAELVGELAAALPRLHLLVTSRRSLGLDGARDWLLPPLEPPAADSDLATAAGNPAVALFVDRAVAARLAFRLGDRNRTAVVGIVRALEGLPLAIELAAARSRAFAPAELLERLRDDPARAGAAASAASMLELLARNGPRAAHDPRHATMERTIAWSWSLLDATEQRLAGAVTAFRGGCSAAMLQAVVGDRDDAALGLDRLLQHNLIHVHADAAGHSATGDAAVAGEAPLRFAFYEPIRRFVAARLSPEAMRLLQARHRAWAIGWLEAMPPTLPIDAVRAELPNLCAVLTSAADDGQGHDAARLVAVFATAPEVLTWPVEVLLAAAPAIARCDDTVLRSRAEAVLAMLLYFAGGWLEEATRHAEAALASAPPASDVLGSALYPVAVLRWRVGRRPAEVLPLLAEARTLAPRDLHLQARVDTLHAFIVSGAADAIVEGGDRAAVALRLHERSLGGRRALGNRHAIHAGQYNIAHIRFRQGRRDEALAGFRDVAAAAASVGDVNLRSRALDAIGECLTELRRFDEAIDALRASVRLAWRHLHRQALYFNLWNLARPLARTGEPERALTLAAFAAGFWRATIGELTADDERELRRVRRLCRAQVPRAACEAAWARGEALALVDAVALALGTSA